MSQKKRKSKNMYLLPSALTLGVLCVVYLLFGLFPFGHNTLAWGDMSQQALPFMMQVKNILAGETSLFYNMQNAAGMNFWGVFLYFVCSPFTLLGVLVPRAGFLYFANVLVALKLMCAACTATSCFGGKNSWFTCDKPQAGVLGTMYAFCGFALLYYQNVVWLDQLILFPLLISSLHMLVEKGRIAPFAAAFTACVVCQFQIGYTVVLALLLCSGLYVGFFASGQKKEGVALRLALGAGIAALASAVAWLPALLQFQASARNRDLVSSLMNTKLLAPYQTTLCMVLCTGAVGAAVVYLGLRKRFTNPGVLYSFCCFCLFCVPMIIDPVNMMWHAGSYQAFPSRYGFIPLFFGLALVADALRQVTQSPAPRQSARVAYRVSAGSTAVFSVLALAVFAFFREDISGYVCSLWGDDKSLLWGAVLFFTGALAYGVVLFFRAKAKLAQKAFVILLCCLVVTQAVYNCAVYIGVPAYQSRGFDYMMDLTEQMPADYTGRVKLSRRYADANMIGAMGYSSIAHYSSFTRPEYISAQKKLGYSGYWMEMSGFGGTLLSDHFLGVGAVVCQRDAIDPAYNEADVEYQNEWYALVRQPHVPSTLTGFVLQANPEDLSALPEGNRFETQDWLYQNVYGGLGPLCRSYAPTQSEGVGYGADEQGNYVTYYTNGGVTGTFEYIVPVGERETLYFDCFKDITTDLAEPVYDSLSVWVNDVYFEGSYPNGGSNGILQLGTFEQEVVKVQIQVLRPEWMRSFGLYGMRHSDVMQAVSTVQTADIQTAGNGFSVRAVAQENDLLVLPLAYDEGLYATVNGQDAEIFQVLDSFVGIRLHAGENQIELGFVPVGFAPGILLSTAGGVALVAVWLLERKRRPMPVYTGGPGLFAQKAAELVLLAGSAVVFLLVYIVPGLAPQRCTRDKVSKDMLN